MQSKTARAGRFTTTPCWLVAGDLLKLLVEELVDLVLGHPAVSPPLPDRCQDLLEGFNRLVGAAEVGCDDLVDVGGGILAALAG